MPGALSIRSWQGARPRHRLVFKSQEPIVAAIRALPQVELIVMGAWMCPNKVCPSFVICNVMVYRDTNYIRATYARSLALYSGRGFEIAAPVIRQAWQLDITVNVSPAHRAQGNRLGSPIAVCAVLLSTIAALSIIASIAEIIDAKSFGSQYSAAFAALAQRRDVRRDDRDGPTPWLLPEEGRTILLRREDEAGCIAIIGAEFFSVVDLAGKPDFFRRHSSGNVRFEAVSVAAVPPTKTKRKPSLAGQDARRRRASRESSSACSGSPHRARSYSSRSSVEAG